MLAIVKWLFYHSSWRFRNFLDLIFLQSDLFDLFCGHKVLGNLPGGVDVTDKHTHKQIECTEYCNDDEDDKVPEHVQIHLANWLLVNLLLEENKLFTIC